MGHKFYSILGLDINNRPSQNDIKKAYKIKAMENHPDKNKGDEKAEERFKEISNAYETLSDENKRRIYDQVGDEGYDESNNGMHGMDHSDIFERFFRGGHNPFGHHFGGFENRQQQDTKCNSINKTITVTLDDVFEGINKNISLTIHKYCFNCMNVCKNCNGSGTVKQVMNMGIMTQIFTGSCDKCNGNGHTIQGKSSCSECSGKGKYTKDINAHLHLPKGIDNGFKTSFPEMGEQPKSANQKPGDLILEVKMAPHQHFRRNGNDLYYKCNLTYIESVIGKEFVIPYFKGNTISVNTRNFGVVYPGKNYMIENMGMPIMNSNKMGNMFIEFNISYPKIKNNEKIDELESLLKEVFIN
jgi:DnaJ family protein A protein 2